MTATILEARTITKRFPGVVALDRVSFRLEAGEVHSLCGENGAGKSTLIKVLGGVIAHDDYEGELLVDGRAVRFESIRDAEKAGIAVIHQELALVEEMTVAENVYLGNEPARYGFVNHDRMYIDTKRVLDQFGLDIDPTRRVGDLGVGQRQLVEIARALSKQARILILDEPTSALTEREVKLLLRIIVDLKKRGVSSIYISHKLDEVFDISDRITVLRDGHSMATMPASEVTEQRLVEEMVGRKVEELFPDKTGRRGEILLEVKGLNVAEQRGLPPRLSDISLEVRSGEVLGIGGLMGAGRSELLMHLFGCYGHRVSGSVSLGGEPLRAESPPASVKSGMVLVTEDRKRYGLSLEASVGFNLSLSALPSLCRGGFVDAGREVEKNREYMQSLSVKAASLEVVVGTLSGGNQQKVVLGRALMTKPRVILLDEPTRGIDIGAKSEIYALIRELTESGLGVVLVSSELPELLGLADRIIMMAEGRIGGVFDDTRGVTQAQLLSSAMASQGRAARVKPPPGGSEGLDAGA